MSLEILLSKYISSTERVFNEMRIEENSRHVDITSVKELINYARNYLNDAKYYRDKKKFEVGLASVTYCEGLLDALRLLGLVKFEWHAEKRQEREK